jgi:hypothetical protein
MVECISDGSMAGVVLPRWCFVYSTRVTVTRDPNGHCGRGENTEKESTLWSSFLCLLGKPTDKGDFGERIGFNLKGTISRAKRGLEGICRDYDWNVFVSHFSSFILSTSQIYSSLSLILLHFRPNLESRLVHTARCLLKYIISRLRKDKAH